MLPLPIALERNYRFTPTPSAVSIPHGLRKRHGTGVAASEETVSSCTRTDFIGAAIRCGQLAEDQADSVEPASTSSPGWGEPVDVLGTRPHWLRRNKLNPLISCACCH